MKIKLLSLTTAFVLLFAPFAMATTINLSTGLDASGNVITTYGTPDANWTVYGATTITDGSAAPVITNPGADWWGGYLANDSSSAWISDNASSNYNGPAPYSFERTFDLTGYDLSTISFSGSWGAADGGTLSLNGHQIASQSNGNGTYLDSFTAPVADFQNGVNTLTITITQSDSYYEAARLQGTLTGSPSSSTVPEPSPLLLFVGCLLGFVAVNRKFRMQN